jgi:hypothetical protein
MPSIHSQSQRSFDYHHGAGSMRVDGEEVAPEGANDRGFLMGYQFDASGLVNSLGQIGDANEFRL